MFSFLSLLIFLVVLSTVERGELKSPTIIGIFLFSVLLVLASDIL
jgi:hypothetical protein